MISINKQGNAIVIEFTDNDKYLFNGKIEVAPNELIVITDDSEMATFRKSSNGDVLFSQLISDIQIAGSPVTQDTIIDQFATIGFISGSGSGEDTVSSVNGQTGDVVITADSLNVYNKTEVDAALNGKQAAGDYATKTELQNVSAEVQHKADKTSVYTKQEVNDKLATKQATLVQGDNITLSTPDAEGKVTISATQPDISGLATKIEVTEGLASKLDTATYNSEKAGFETKTNAANTYATIQSVEEVSGEVATLSTGKQDKLVSGTNIKTINGNSILGEGNIEITGGGASNKTWYFSGATEFLTGASVNAGLNVIGGTISYDQVSVGDIVVLDDDYEFVVLNKYADTYGKHIAIMPIYNAVTNDSTVLGYVMDLQDTASASIQINKATMTTPVTFKATADKNIRVETNTDGAISLSGFTGYSKAKPGDVVKITYSNYNWNLVVTGRYKDNNGTYLALSGLGDKFTGYRIGAGNLMYSYVPFDKSADVAIVLGRGAVSNGGTKYEVAIGIGATTNGTNAVAIGSYGTSANRGGTAVGSQADANEDGSTVIGANLKANKQDGSTPEKVLVGYYDTANSASVPVLAYNKTDGARIKSGNSLKKIATDDQLPKLVTLTQSEYDALTTKDENTYYFIKEA